MADQLAPHFTGAYGHPVVQTPALDALAGRGVRFDAAYCNFPLCAPSRFSMLSGQLPTAIGAWDNGAEFAASVPTLVHYLRLLGYRTTLSGKMHFIGPDQLHGFEQRLTTDIYPSGFALTPDWEAASGPPSDWYTMASLSEAGPVVTNYQHDFDEETGFAAVQHLYDLARAADDERPFFLVASFTHPHDPYEARQPWWDLYDHDDIDLPDPIAPDAVDPHTLRLRRGIGADGVGFTDEQCRNARHGYYANTSYFDSWVGRLVEVLDETGRWIHCEGDPPLLYDLIDDPLERNNLASDPAHAELAAAFAAETAERWDSAALRDQVLASQRSRRVVSAAVLAAGTGWWDYSPQRNTAGEYLRDGMNWLNTSRGSRIPTPR